MTNSKDTTTTTSQGSSAEGEQPRNEKFSSNVTGAAPTAPPSTHAPTPTPPPPPHSTGQVNAGGGDSGFVRSSGTPPVRTHLATGQFNVGGGFATGGSSVTPPGPNKGSSGRGSPSPSRGTSTPRRGSPSGGRRTPSRGSKSPPSGTGSPSSSPAAGNISQIGGSSFTPVRVEISLGGELAAAGSMAVGGQLGKRKAEVNAPEGVTPTCPVCNRGRGSSPAAGNISQIGGSSFTPVRVEISLGGGLAAAGSMAMDGQLGKRKAEVNAPEGVTPTCPVCNRSDFSSWKALFGHQRSQPECRYRSAFQPPGQQQGEACNAANVREARDMEEDNEGRGGIDLNMPPLDDDDDVTDDNRDGGDGGGGDEA